MIKKLSILLVVIAAFVFAYGAAMTAFAEDRQDDASISASADASISITTDDDEDEDSDDDGDNEDDGSWSRSRDDMQEKRMEVREERQGFFDMFRARKAEVREDIRVDIKQNRRGLIEARWKMIGARFENVITRLDSRIVKMKAEGEDTASAEIHMANAKQAVVSAQVKAQALAAAAEDGTLDKEAVMASGAEIKADLELAKVELKLAIRVLAALNAESEDSGDDNE